MMVYYTAMKMDKVQLYETWMNLIDIRFSKEARHKRVQCMIPLMKFKIRQN